MTTTRPIDFARHFPENGMKLLLQQPDNLRDLLCIARSALVPLLDFKHLQPDPTNYVQRDYRHIESDLVLRVPFKGRRRSLLVYILLEHQSDLDEFMLFRVLQYDVGILSSQMRSWLQDHGSLDGFRFQPVLPIVFYTGVRPWPDLGRLADLFVPVPEVEEYLPSLKPLFVNLPETDPAHLVGQGGAFGQVLRVFQARREQRAAFENSLEEAVRTLEKLPRSGGLRWQELMSYLHALVYHERVPTEHAELQERIEQSVRNERRRQEVSEMKRTIADMFREEGQLNKARQTLLRLLRLRFGDLPVETTNLIEGCTEPDQLDAWLDAFVTARTLAQVGIRSSN